MVKLIKNHNENEELNKHYEYIGPINNNSLNIF